LLRRNINEAWRYAKPAHWGVQNGGKPVDAVDVETTWESLVSRPGAQLIDVRTRAEWSYVGIPDLVAIRRIRNTPGPFGSRRLPRQADDGTGRRLPLQAVAETLNAMAFGGIHDHLGGGMHRYSTEPTWSVPHFEKMRRRPIQRIRCCDTRASRPPRLNQ
jgi:hypothetical protein